MEPKCYGTRRSQEPIVDALPSLTDAEKATLLGLARAGLRAALKGEAPPTPEALGHDLTPRLAAPGGAFVTLHLGGALRGCIGDLRPSRSLWRVVVEMAVGAGTRDPRFRSIERRELRALDVHVSVLSTPHAVDGPSAIEIGRHGIILEKDGRSAVFLPQVAPEQGWDLDTTLTRLSTKAGLDAEAWRHGARFLVFEAEGFA